MIQERFLIYEYYYSIPCSACGKHLPALDFAEIALQHPIQFGEFRPSTEFVLWIPTGSVPTGNPFPRSAELIPKGSLPLRLDTALDSVDVWDKIAPTWVEDRLNQPDLNHRYIIIPEVLKLLGVNSGEKVLDFACGEGNIARVLAKQGVLVTGIDPSKMIDYAIELEKEDNFGIEYLKSDSLDSFLDNTFDKAVCNMAFMDIPLIKPIMSEIHRVLKPGGIFVFSITHPCFNIPVLNPVKFPWDSERNEDRVYMVDNYYNSQPSIYEYNGKKLQYFHRTISQYTKYCVNAGFSIEAIEEPTLSDERLIKNNPRDLYLEFSRIAKFMVFSVRKKLIK